MRHSGMTLLGLAVFLTACGTEPPTGTGAPGASLRVGRDGDLVTGGGVFEHPTLGPFNFGFNAMRHEDGSVSGRFEYHYWFATAEPTSAPVMYKGEVTCFAIDPENHHAWIGGVLTFSNDPAAAGNPIFRVGHDAWFRMLDNGSGGAGDPDRITAVGFEGSAGIGTSEEYCD